MSHRLAKCLFFGGLIAVVGCDESEVLHEPHPSLERMQTQPRVDPFAREGMRSPPYGSISLESEDDIALDGGDIPLVVDDSLLETGRASFDRICATCHGVAGDGKSVVAEKMLEAPPGSLVDGPYASRSPAEVYDAIRNGKRSMPSFAHELTTRESWATVAYLRALQLSRHVSAAALSPEDRRALTTEGEAR